MLTIQFLRADPGQRPLAINICICTASRLSKNRADDIPSLLTDLWRIACRPELAPSARWLISSLPTGCVMHPAIKCTLVGDSGVGKTCLLVSYEYNGFPTNYIPHMGSPSSHIHLMIGEVLYMLDLFDTSGKADYDLLRPLSYPQSDVVLVCFSVGMPTSFENVRDKWFPEAHHFCPGVPCVIAATQIDLRDDDDVEPGKEKMRKPLITTAQGERLARELGAADYVECSAKTCKGMKDAFDVVVAAGIKYQSSLTKRKRKCIVV